MNGTFNTVTGITILTALVSFLTMVVVMIIGWVVTRMQRSIDAAHTRLDTHIDVNNREMTDIRKEFVSEIHCASRMKD